MATADVDARTEGEAEAAPAIEPSLGWDESVAARPMGRGWDSGRVVLDRDGRGSAGLLVLANGGRSARLYRPAGEGEFPRPYDAGTPVEGLGGLRCACPIPNGPSGRSDLVAL